MSKQFHRVLVVDDESDIREFLCQVLESEGFEVQTAENGKVALARAEESVYDLVLLDLIMPEREGIETLTALTARWKHLPVIVMSGVPRYLPIAGSLGAACLLEKPFDELQVLAAVRAALGGNKTP